MKRNANDRWKKIIMAQLETFDQRLDSVFSFSEFSLNIELRVAKITVLVNVPKNDKNKFVDLKKNTICWGMKKFVGETH